MSACIGFSGNNFCNEAISWSADNRLALASGDGIKILTVMCRANDERPELSFHQSFILITSDVWDISQCTKEQTTEILSKCSRGMTVLAIRRAVLYLSSKCPSRALMTGKTVIVTGANCGIGYTTALDLARRNARVILACRNETAASKAAKRISRQTGNESVIAKHLDLSSLKSVRKFCAEIANEEDKVDVLINNAGVFGCPYKETEDGFETHMAVNHFGNFLLTNLLKDSLYKAPSSRVVFVSAALHKRGKVNIEDMNSISQYKKGKPYADSKLANILFAREFHKRESSSGKLCVYSVHPGVVRTNVARHTLLFNNYFRVICSSLLLVLYPLYLLLIKSATEGCQTVVYCAVAPELEGQSDCYYGNCHNENWTEAASDMEMAKRVWELSAKLCHYDSY